MAAGNPAICCLVACLLVGVLFPSAGPRLMAPIGCLVKFLLVDYFTDLEPVNAAVRR